MTAAVPDAVRDADGRPSGAGPVRIGPVRIGIVVLPRFTLTPFSLFVDAFRLAADDGDRSRQRRCRWSVLAAADGPVRSSCGLAVLPDGRPERPERFDYVAVVGGVLDRPYRSDPSVDRFLREAASAGCVLVGLCTGSLALAAAGLLEGRRCCVSWFHRFDVADLFPTVRPVADCLYLADGNRITCAGGVGAVQVALRIVERHLGARLAAKCRRILMVDGITRSAMPQPVADETALRDDRVQRAALLIEQDPAGRTPIADLARAVLLSARQLERLFLRELGMTPSAYRRRARMLQARELVERSSLSMTSVALECGFQSAGQFSNEFRRQFLCAPSAMRRSARPAR